MARKGMLINYDYCTGCRAPARWPAAWSAASPTTRAAWPWRRRGHGNMLPDRYQFSYLPVLTDQCDQCAERREAGKDPACVHHCQAFVMRYGDVSELAGQAEEGSKSVLYFS